jgi:rare lipoprotein A (peptidoglycan hydrolase)
MIALLLLAALQVGTGTVFSRIDAANPDPRLACSGRVIDDRSFVVAHNILPCHSRVWLYNPRTGRSTVATVMDRGPLHAKVDMSPATARALRHNGKERVVIVPLPTVEKRTRHRLERVS